MTKTSPTPTGFDLWFPRLVRLSGLGLLFFEAGYERADRPYLIAAAVGLIFFENVYRLQQRVRNGRNNQ